MATATVGVRASPWEALERAVRSVRVTVPWGEAFAPDGYGPGLVLEEVWFGTDAGEKARVPLPAAVTFDGKWVGLTARAPFPASTLLVSGRLFLRFSLEDPPRDALWFRTGLLALSDTARVDLKRYAVFEKLDPSRAHPGFSG